MFIRDYHFPSYAELQEPQLRRMWEEQLVDVKAFMPYNYAHRHVSLHVHHSYGRALSRTPLYLVSCLSNSLLTIAPLTFLARMNYGVDP